HAPRARTAAAASRASIARPHFPGAPAAHRTRPQLRPPVGGRRHDLGRAGVAAYDRRTTGAGRSDIGTIGKRSACSHHCQRENDSNGLQSAATLADRLLFGTVVAVTVLVAVGIILRIGLIVLRLLRAGVGLTVQRIVIARWIGL